MTDKIKEIPEEEVTDEGNNNNYYIPKNEKERLYFERIAKESLEAYRTGNYIDLEDFEWPI